MNGADVIAHILKAEGVEVLPCFPHSDLIEAAAKLGIRPVVVRQERQALHIADGYARMSGGRKPSVATVQYGPGSENAMGSVAQCYADNVPLLYIPGGYPRDQQGVAPNFDAGRALKPYTKWCETVRLAERIPQMMQHAFAQLRNGRPGPVALEVPIDIFAEEVDPGLAESYRPQRRSAPQADAGDVAAAVEALLGAEAPVIVAGQGVLYGEAWDELQALAELVEAPVMTTLNAKSAFPEDHPLALGCAACSRPDPVVQFLDEADLLFGVATSFTRSDYITPFPTAGRKVVQITNSETDLAKDIAVDLGVIGDAKATLQAMIEEARGRLGNRRSRGLAERIAARRAAFAAEWMPLLTSEETPINPYRVINDLMGTVERRRTVVTHDAGSPRDQTTAFYEALVPHGYMGWGKTTQLGLGLGLMMGAKLARPDWLCVNLMGDAAFGMVGMDFETAARCRIPILTIVLKNGVMGGYSEYHPAASESYAINELGGDYAKVAEALGGYGERVEAPGEIKPALARAIAETEAGRPALLEVITKEEPRFAKKLPRL